MIKASCLVLPPDKNTKEAIQWPAVLKECPQASVCSYETPLGFSITRPSLHDSMSDICSALQLHTACGHDGTRKYSNKQVLYCASPLRCLTTDSTQLILCRSFLTLLPSSGEFIASKLGLTRCEDGSRTRDRQTTNRGRGWLRIVNKLWALLPKLRYMITSHRPACDILRTSSA